MSNATLIDEVKARESSLAVSSSPAEKFILYDVWWETYEQLLANYNERQSPRFAYDDGTLEIMILSAKHEEPSRTIASLIEILAEEFGINFRNLGSTTFRRKKMKKGFEPDSCFYIQNVGRIKGKEEIDLEVDPPPDLTVEIDITSPSLNRFPIYAAIGIPEIWRYDGARMMFYQLSGGVYAEVKESAALPRVNSQIVTQFIAESRTLERLDWLRRVRAWARTACE
ncbi:Uma2 family endonuclease [soil metagenome]